MTESRLKLSFNIRPRCRVPGYVVGAALLFVGCAKDDRLPTYPVRGTVAFPDASPLRGGWIVLESPKHGLAARGTIDESGSFTVGTYDPMDGAVAGRHQVAIIPAAPSNQDPDAGLAISSIHPRYSHMDTSGILFDVRPDGVNEFPVIVEPPDP